MSAPQTSVENAPDIGIVGQLADFHTSADGDVVSRTSEETSATIAFGLFVKHGTADEGVGVVSATSNLLEGIAVHGHGFEPGKEVDATTGALLPKATFGVLRRGRAFVKAVGSVTPASEVHVRASGTGVAGSVQAAADATHTIDISPFARFVTSGDDGDVVVLEIDMTNVALATADT